MLLVLTLVYAISTTEGQQQQKLPTVDYSYGQAGLRVRVFGAPACSCTYQCTFRRVRHRGSVTYRSSINGLINITLSFNAPTEVGANVDPADNDDQSKLLSKGSCLTHFGGTMPPLSEIGWCAARSSGRLQDRRSSNLRSLKIL